MHIEFPEGPTGIHPSTAALQKILHTKNIQNPVTGEPYSEALLLGLGGGLDIGYILYQFSYLPHPTLVLGFRNQWNNTRAFVENITTRLSIDVLWQEFSDHGSAQKALQTALQNGSPAIVWVDKASLPYRDFPKLDEGYHNYQVGVHARDGRLWQLYVDDLSTHLFEVREKEFTAARAALSQNNFLMMVVRGSRGIQIQDLREAILEGIRECSVQLNHPVKSVGVTSLDYWAEKINHPTDSKGWPVVYRDPHDLFFALRTLYTAIRIDGTEGYALRRMYSDFLHESAGILGNPGLNAVAGQYLQLSNHWASLAEDALSSQVTVFEQLKFLLRKQAKSYRESNLPEYHKTQKELLSLEKGILKDFPLDHHGITELLSKLATQVKLISELERSAALRLRDIAQG
ncbi:MAG TPA: hypothetical protein DF984_08455 [Anaerolineaceae bacterium]|jgi:hypothetical protein|nr:hypothetical protein [Anaerolineaceae bacterium]